MLFSTTSPYGPSTVTDDWQATLDIVEAAAEVERTRRELREAEIRRYDARQAVIAAEQAEQDARDRAPRCPGECPCSD
jgi:ABC-type transporter lipoprotein component MlaA